MKPQNVGKSEALSFEQVTQAFENKEAADRLREALVLKPFMQERVQQRVNVAPPRVKTMALAVNHACAIIGKSRV